MIRKYILKHLLVSNIPVCMGVWNDTLPTNLNTGILIIGFFFFFFWISVLWNTIWDTQF